MSYKDNKDRIEIELCAGYGGNGCVSLKRESHTPFGGPDGGRGGDGGSVYFKASKVCGSLSHITSTVGKRSLDGADGLAQKRTGEKGSDLYLDTPLGTTVCDEKGGFLSDLVEQNDTFLVAKGGVGGAGNTSYRTSQIRTPYLAEGGTPGECIKVLLDYRVPNDVAIVGYTNTSKSTILSLLSSATPKVADYEYTTVEPTLGVLRDTKRSYKLLEIPSFAKDGGLGDAYIKHLSRSKGVLVTLDVEKKEYLSILSDILNRLNSFSSVLKKLRTLVVLTSKNAPSISKAQDVKKEIEDLSLAQIEGVCDSYYLRKEKSLVVDELKQFISTVSATKERDISEFFKGVVIKPKPKDTPKVLFEGKDSVRIVHPYAVRLAKASDLNRPEALAQFRVKLRDMKVIQELEKLKLQGISKVFVDKWSLSWGN